MAFATSSTSPARRSGTPWSIFARTADRQWRPTCASAASAPDARVGANAVRPNCTAVDLVSVRTAPLEAL